MRIKIILIILLLLAMQAFSQVTLNSTYNPIAGDLQQITDCDTTGIIQGNAGANQTWNFTTISSRNVTFSSFVPVTSTPYASQFPSSTVASSTDNSNYSFYTTSNTNFIVNGFGSPNFVISFTDPEIFMQYPFTYNSSFNDNFSGNFEIGGIPTFRTGNINVLGDAWGTIMLPSGTYINALRLKINTVTTDSSNFIISSVILTNSTSYEWFVPGFKFPVFIINYTTTSINGTNQYSGKNVSYNPGASSIGINPISSEVPREFKLYQNYPNPFNPVTKIKFDITESRQVTLLVYDVMGREVAKPVDAVLKAGSYDYLLNAGALTSGVYFYKLIAGSFSQTRKMTLIR